jgi:hypothetical protein
MLLGGKGLRAGEPAPDPLDLPPAPTTGPIYNATNTGSGAIAQGSGAVSVAPGGVFVGGKNTGNINTGTQVHTGGGACVAGNVTAGGDFIGRDKIVAGLSGAELAPLFAQLSQTVLEHASTNQKQNAIHEVQKLQAEVAKGKQAEDSKIAKIIDGLTSMVPGAIGAVVSLFAHLILNGIAGNATRFVLDRLQGK